MEDSYNQTSVHPLGLAAIVALGAMLLILPRRQAPLTFVIMACLVATGQRIAIASIDLTFLRLLILIGWLRLLVRGELVRFRWNAMDSTLVVWAAIGTVTFTTLKGDSAALIWKIGQLVDTLGIYLLFRFMLRSWEDVEKVTYAFAVLGIPTMLALTLEQLTGNNIFSVMGGVPAVTQVRDGRLRAQGAFAHPIIAGCFWASLMPLLAWLWHSRGNRMGLVGLGCALLIVAMTASSTPVGAVMFGIVGFALFPMRWHMRWLVAIGIATAFGLHLFMNNPVWHLLARIDLAGGSTGFYRFLLIDNSIRNFHVWWLNGTNTMDFIFPGADDITNHYLLQCFHGGFFTFLAFVAIMTTGFLYVGQMLRASSSNASLHLLAWCLGTCLFQHAMNFVAVSYFGQAVMLLHLQFAIIAGMRDRYAALAQEPLAP